MAVYSPQNEWVRNQNALWRELAGGTIIGWSGVDFSVGQDDDEPIFLGPSDVFRQLWSVRLQLVDGSSLAVATYQNDSEFGLKIDRADDPTSSELMAINGLLRESDLSDLPVGPIERLEVRLDNRSWSDFDLIEVVITIGGRSVLIVAAEVYPVVDGTLYAWGDESLFVFADPAKVDQLTWMGSRLFISREILPGDNGGNVFEGVPRAVTRMTVRRVLDATFAIVRWQVGYDIEETQDLMGRVLDALDHYQFGAHPPRTVLTAKELRSVALRPTKLRKGFAQPEVDAMIREVAATLEEWERS